MTARQRNVLLVINDMIAESGVSPSAAQIGARLGISRVVTNSHVRALVDEGYVRRAGGGRSIRTLEVLRLPGNALRADEIAWCHANPERVRAMMALVRAPGQAPSVERAALLNFGPDADQAVALGREKLDVLEPGASVEIALPIEAHAREGAYRRLSMMAFRRFGRGGAVREMTQTSVFFRRIDRRA